MRITKSVEGPIDLGNDVRRAFGDIFVSGIVCTENTKRKIGKEESKIGRTIKAGQEVHGRVVKPGETVGRSRKLKIRNVRQLIVPPRRVNGSVRA